MLVPTEHHGSARFGWQYDPSPRHHPPLPRTPILRSAVHSALASPGTAVQYVSTTTEHQYQCQCKTSVPVHNVCASAMFRLTNPKLHGVSVPAIA
eukprot:998008-Rhodomonas_salina.2